MKKISAVFIGSFVVLKRIAFLVFVIAAGYPLGWVLFSAKFRPFTHELDAVSIFLGIFGAVFGIAFIGLVFTLFEKLAQLGGWKKTKNPDIQNYE